MALAGETTGESSITCSDCNYVMNNEVLKSAAGYYIGKFCYCGPYSRESRYYETHCEAKDNLHIYDPR